MKFTVLTLFPNLIQSFLAEGLTAQARTKGLIEVTTLNPRDFATDIHRTVDDRAFGGGDGMVMKVEPLARAIESLQDPTVRVVVLTPQGRPWDQSQARRWAEEGGHVALVCGRYAGIDERFHVRYADEEVSLGDFVLNGGEVAALALIESVTRLRPGVLGNATSSKQDSFSDEWFECPQFTKPRQLEGLDVPEVLLSGNHARIATFKLAVAMVRTALRRPDLMPSGRRLGQKLGPMLDTIDQLPEPELLALGLTRDHLTFIRHEWA